MARIRTTSFACFLVERFAVISVLALAAPCMALASTIDAMAETRATRYLGTPESVKASPFSGTAAYSYRLEVPPGTGGLTPTLVLTYNSDTHHSEYGYGWSLNISRIERSTRSGAPVYSDPLATTGAIDLFELDGDLLAREPGTNRFHRRYADGSRIVFLAATNAWELTRQDGTKLFFGESDDSRIDLTGGQPTFRWSLSRVVDPRGNSYEISYREDAPSGDELYIYPEAIRNSFHEFASTGTLQESRLLEFEWAERGYASAGELGTDDAICDGREDCPTSFRSGKMIQRRLRLVGVRVGIDASGDQTVDDSELIRRYEMAYSLKTDASAEGSNRPPYSRLDAIRRYGDDNLASLVTQFTYAPVSRGYGASVSWGVVGYLSEGDGTSTEGWIDKMTVDMNGDGLPDRVRVTTSGQWKVRYGTPTGFGTQEVTWLWDCAEDGTPSEAQCSAGRSAHLAWETEDGSFRSRVADLVDMDGDLLPDRVTRPTDSNYWKGLTVRRNNGSAFEAPVFWGPPPSLESDFRGVHESDDGTWQYVNPTWRMMADLNGDGRPDYVTWDKAYYNNGAGFDPFVFHGIAFQLDQIMRPLGSAQDYLWASVQHLVDANGDGLPDYVPGQLCLLEPGWVGFNRGEVFGFAPNSPCTSYGPLNVSPGDHFSEYIELRPIHGELSTTYTALTDLNGDGVRDFVISHMSADPSGVPGSPAWEAYLGLGDGRFLTTGAPGDGPGALPPGIVWDMSGLGWDAVHHGTIQALNRSMRDMNGDGLPDYVRGLSVVHLHPGPTGLLTGVVNELGGTTTIEYKPSTHFAFPADPADPSPEFLDFIDFRDAHAEAGLPEEVALDARPKWLVSRISVNDGRTATDQVDTFQYAGQRFDSLQREGLGSRASERRDATGVAVRSVHHQDPAKRGRLEFREVCEGTGSQMQCPATQQTVWTVFEPVNGEAFLARPGSTTTSWFDADASCDGEGTLVHGVVRDWAQDATGNLLSETDCGADGNCTTEADNLVRTFTYARNDAEWMVSYVGEQKLYFGSEASGSLEAHVRNRYDVAAFTEGDPIAPPKRCAAESAPCGGLVSYRETLRDVDANEWAVEHLVYDDFGNLTRYDDPRAVDEGTGATLEAAYDDATHTFPASITDAVGDESTFAFDEGFGRVRKALAANGYLTCWDYDALGRLQARSDAPSEVTVAVDDPGATCSRALSAFEYLNLGKPDMQYVLETYESGVYSDVRRLRYLDGLGREYELATEAKEDEFDVVLRGWGPRGELSCESLPFREGTETPTECDLAEPRRVAGYDALLRPRSLDLVESDGTTVRPEMAATRCIEDTPSPAQLVETWITRAGGTTPDRKQAVGIDARGAVVMVRDDGAGGGTTRLHRDPKGRISQVDGPDVAIGRAGTMDPNLIEITYNAVDQRTSLSQPPTAGGGGPIWVYQYDLNGDLFAEVSPRVVAGSNPPRNVEVRYHYDRARRLRVKDYDPFSTIESPGVGDIVFDYYTEGPGRGLLASAGSATGTAETFEYDLMGRLTARTKDYGDARVFSFGYTYDLLDRPFITTLPDQSWYAHFWSGSQLTGIQSSTGGQTGVTDVLVSNVSWHPSGALEAADLISLVGAFPTLELRYGFDASDHRLRTAQTVSNPWDPSAPSQTLQDFLFTYDTAGNLMRVDDQINGPGSLGKRTQVFTYDALHRLATATGLADPGGYPYGPFSYQYDAAGNLREKGTASAAPGDERLRLIYDRPAGSPLGLVAVDRHNGVDWDLDVGSYVFDAEGGVVSRTKDGAVTSTVARNPDGRLQTVSLPEAIPGVPESAIYTYDFLGQREEKLKTAPWTISAQRLYVDPSYEVDVVNEKHQVHFFVGAQRVATSWRDGLGIDPVDPPPVPPPALDQVLFYHPDPVGTNALITRHDGAVVLETYHDPFGAIDVMQSGAGQPIPPAWAASKHLYTDQEHDPETSLDAFPARSYDAWVGRFWSQDPALLGPFPGASFAGLAAGDGQQGNAYAYVMNRPTVLVDPTGAFAFDGDPNGGCDGWSCSDPLWEINLYYGVPNGGPYQLSETSWTPPETVPTAGADPAQGEVQVANRPLCEQETSMLPCDGFDIDIIGPRGRLSGRGGYSYGDRVSTRTPTDRFKEQLLERASKPKSATALRAAQEEAAGVRQGTGHITKVRNAQRGLVNRIQQLKRRLGGDTDLSPPERRSLEAELSAASRLLDFSEQFLPR